MSAIDSILTTEQYQTQQANAMYKDGNDDEMLGRDAFLQLFTAQLKNPEPARPDGERGVCRAVGAVLVC